MKTVLLFIFILSYSSLMTNGNSKEDLTKAVEVVNNAKDVLESITEIMFKGSPGHMFAFAGRYLTMLGPVMMGVSAVMSVVAIFLPQEDSEELKAIKEGFKKVNLKLDVISADLRDLKNIVELSNAKSAYIKCVTAINSNYITLTEARIGKEKKYYDFFITQYESTFLLATDNLYDAMTGRLGAFGFNLVTLYRDYVKCNSVLISKFCTFGIQLLIKGVTIDGAYLGAKNLTETIKSRKILWKKNLKELSESCEAVIRNCVDNWKITSAQQFRETYKREVSQDKKDLPKKIVTALNEIAPERGWFAISYKDTTGFNDHAFTSFYDCDKIWNQNNIDVTICSFSQLEPYVGTEFDDKKYQLNEKINKINSVNDCAMTKWRTNSIKDYVQNDLRPMLEFIFDIVKYGVVYIVKSDLNPEYAISGNTLFTQELNWKCASKKYRILIFI